MSTKVVLIKNKKLYQAFSRQANGLNTEYSSSAGSPKGE